MKNNSNSNRKIKVYQKIEQGGITKMIFLINDKVPHVRILFHSGMPIPERLDKENVADAFRDLISTYRGVIDYVKIMDGVGDGVYSPQEVIVAGVFITDAETGALIKKGYYERAKYIRVNGLDMVLSLNDYRVLSGEELSGFKFDSDNGKIYKLKTRCVDNSEIYAESSHANDRSPKDE